MIFTKNFINISNKQSSQNASNETDVDNIEEEEVRINKCSFRQCGVAPISFNIQRQFFGVNDFLLIGDILIQISEQREEDFYDLMRKALLLQDKKVINQIHHYKEKQLIHGVHTNKYRGSCDFKSVIGRLLSSQSQLNKDIADELVNYQSYIDTIEPQYESLIQIYGWEYLHEQLQIFFQTRMNEFVYNFDKEDCYSYFCVSYLEQNELGIPLNVQFGISESICAILGCTADQMIDILGRTSHISFFLGRDVMPNMVVSSIQLMKHIQQFQQFSDYLQWESPGQMVTLDGILVDFKIRTTQYQKRVDNLLIGAFFHAEFIILPETILNIIEIRQSKSNYYNPRNIIDFLIVDNLQNTIAQNFYQYITDEKNFRPPSDQDQYPEKTCKYKYILE